MSLGSLVSTFCNHIMTINWFNNGSITARVPSLLLLLASLYLTLQMVNINQHSFNTCYKYFMNQIACFMVTEPSIDEELVPKNEDVNGNQEILMDQVF